MGWFQTLKLLFLKDVIHFILYCFFENVINCHSTWKDWKNLFHDWIYYRFEEWSFITTHENMHDSFFVILLNFEDLDDENSRNRKVMFIFTWHSINWRKKILQQILQTLLRRKGFNLQIQIQIQFKIFQSFYILWWFTAFSRRKVPLLCHLLHSATTFLNKMNDTFWKAACFKTNPSLLSYVHPFSRNYMAVSMFRMLIEYIERNKINGVSYYAKTRTWNCHGKTFDTFKFYPNG